MSKNEETKNIKREMNPFEDSVVADFWEQTLEHEGMGGERALCMYPLINEWLSENSIKKLVDMGCGNGFQSTLIPKNIFYTGVEPSQALLLSAEKKYKDHNPENVEYKEGNSYESGLPGNTFDGFLSVMVWFHLKDLERANQEMKRLLKTGGKGLIITTNPKALEKWKSFFENYNIEGNLLIGKVHTPGIPLPESHFYIYSDEEYIKSFEDAGFKVVSYKTIGSGNEESEQLFVAIEVEKV